MTTFGLPADCPVCGATIHLMNSTTNGVLSVGIFRCDPCRREYEVTCRMTVHHRDKVRAG